MSLVPRGLRFCTEKRTIFALIGGMLLSGALLATPLIQNSRNAPGGVPQVQSPFPPPETTPSQPQTQKQKQNVLKYNFQEMKKNADQLAEMAKALQNQINHSSENVLSLDIIKKAEEIEKLARKVKNEAKGY